MKDRLIALRKFVFPMLGYGSFFFFFLLLFAYLTFPYDRVRDFVVQEVENPKGRDGSRSPSGYSLEIIDLSPSFFTGVTLSGVSLQKLPEEEDELPVGMTFERVDARVSVLGLISGEPGGTFDTDVAGGNIAGEVSMSEERTSIQATLDSVQLRRAGLIRAQLGLPMSGKVGGEIDLVLAEERDDTDGTIALTIEGLEIGDGRAKLKVRGLSDGITIARIDAGQVDVRVNVVDGTGTFEQLRARGDHIELDGEGQINLVRNAKNSTLDLLLRVKFNDAYAESDERAETMMSLLRMHPRIQRASPSPGVLQYNATGPLARISWTPAKGRPAPAGSSE